MAQDQLNLRDKMNILRKSNTVDQIRSRRPENWDSFFLALEFSEIPENFLSYENRNQGSQEQDPFSDVSE